MGNAYKESPIGTALHAHLNEPDTKFNADGLWHTKLVLEGDAAEEFRKKLDPQVEEALRKHTEGMKPGEAKKWRAHYPYEVEEDPDNGNETGRIAFIFKQNALIILRDGTKKPVVIGIRDAKDKPITDKIISGDKIKVLYSERETVATSNKTVGIRLDFAMVMLVEKGPRKGGGTGGGFTPVEGGFTKEAPDDNSEEQGGSTDGDY